MSAELYKKQYDGLTKIMPQQKAMSEIVFSPVDSTLMNRGTGVFVDEYRYGKTISKEKTLKDEFFEYLREYLPRNAQA